MQKLTLILMLVSISFLESCDGFPSISPKERCTIVLQESLEKSHCRCTMYQWSHNDIGPIGDPKNYPVEKCNKFTGYSPDDYVAIYEWENEIRLWLIRHDKK